MVKGGVDGCVDVGVRAQVGQRDNAGNVLVDHVSGGEGVGRKTAIAGHAAISL